MRVMLDSYFLWVWGLILNSEGHLLNVGCYKRHINHNQTQFISPPVTVRSGYYIQPFNDHSLAIYVHVYTLSKTNLLQVINKSSRHINCWCLI